MLFLVKSPLGIYSRHLIPGLIRSCHPFTPDWYYIPTVFSIPRCYCYIWVSRFLQSNVLHVGLLTVIPFSQANIYLSGQPPPTSSGQINTYPTRRRREHRLIKGDSDRLWDNRDMDELSLCLSSLPPCTVRLFFFSVFGGFYLLGCLNKSFSSFPSSPQLSLLSKPDRPNECGPSVPGFILYFVIFPFPHLHYLLYFFSPAFHSEKLWDICVICSIYLKVEGDCMSGTVRYSLVILSHPYPGTIQTNFPSQQFE